MKRTMMLFLPMATVIVVVDGGLALTGQTIHPWRLAWLLPLALVITLGICAAASRLKP